MNTVMGTTQSVLDDTYSSIQQQTHGFGWKPDLPDIHDKYYQFDKLDVEEDSSEYDTDDDAFNIKGVDLRDQFPPVYDQEELHTSVPCSVLSVWRFFHNKSQTDQEQPFEPSRTHLHQLTSLLDNSDRSTSIKNCLQVLEKAGVVSEDIIGYGEYPEPDERFLGIDTTVSKQMKYRRVQQTKEQLKRALDAGYPVIFGMSIYSSMLTDGVARSGIVKLPSKSDRVVGGQSMVLVGYDNDKKCWLARNHWGSKWGDKGYCWIPFNYLTNPQLAGDFWVISKLDC